MSGQNDKPKQDVYVPLSVVFMAVGLVIVLAVTAVWLLAPHTMPRPVYAAVQGLLPATNPEVVPTPATAATLPLLAATPETAVLLPETAPELTAVNGENVVTLAEALQRGPRPGEPQRIVIPDIGLDAPVEQIGVEPVQSGGNTYYQWLVPEDFVAGWHDNSARLGQPGNTVLNGHHNVHGEVFRDIVDLQVGDEILLYDASGEYSYVVTEKEILLERGQSLDVRLANAQWIAPTEDERITLVTCWPYTDNSHRLIVVAQPVAAGQSSQ